MFYDILYYVVNALPNLPIFNSVGVTGPGSWTHSVSQPIGGTLVQNLLPYDAQLTVTHSVLIVYRCCGFSLGAQIKVNKAWLSQPARPSAMGVTYQQTYIPFAKDIGEHFFIVIQQIKGGSSTYTKDKLLSITFLINSKDVASIEPGSKIGCRIGYILHALAQIVALYKDQRQEGKLFCLLTN